MAKKPNEIEIPEDLLISDDLMPNDGEPFQVGDFVDEEAVEEDKIVKSMVTGAAPMINMLLDWLNADIKSSGDIEQINLESKIPTDSQIIAAKQIKAKLKVIKGTLLNMADAHGVKYNKNKAKNPR